MPEPQNTVYINVTGFQLLENLSHEALDLYVTTCGIQNCMPSHFFGPGKREEYILHFICEGTGRYETNGRSYDLKKGAFFLICPKETVCYRANSWQNYLDQARSRASRGCLL